LSEVDVDSDLFLIGKIVSAHGLKGAVRVLCAEKDLNLFMSIKSVQLKKEGNWLPAAVTSIKKDKDCFLFGFSQITDRDAADSIIGSEVWVNQDQINSLESNQWWTRDLIGLEVFKETGELIGTVCDVIVSANTLLEIRRHDNPAADTILIPFVEALVPKVDISNKRIEIANLPGLID
jgi:16S rRNA processing protein RimM